MSKIWDLPNKDIVIDKCYEKSLCYINNIYSTTLKNEPNGILYLFLNKNIDEKTNINAKYIHFTDTNNFNIIKTISEKYVDFSTLDVTDDTFNYILMAIPESSEMTDFHYYCKLYKVEKC